MSNELSSRITMMQYDAPNQLLCGRVRLNGRERSVMPFKVAIGASASEKENKLIERAISVKRKAVDKQEMKLMDWVGTKEIWE